MKTSAKAYCFILLLSGFSLQAQTIDSIKIKYYGRFWNSGHAEASIVSQDGGFSYRVPGGSLWWFGDTFKGKRDSTGVPHFEGGAVSCCTAFLDENRKSIPPVLKYLTGSDGTVEQAINFLPGEGWDKHRIWPNAGIYLNGKSYVFYSLIEITGKGEWDFKGAGNGLAYSESPHSVHKRIVKNSKWNFPVNPCSIIQLKGWLFFYEIDEVGKKKGIVLSRVKEEEIENPEAYRFYCGDGNYTSDKEKRIIILENIHGQVSAAYNEYLNKFILASSSDFFNPLEIKFFTFDSPEGPFTKSKAIIKAPFVLQGKAVNLVYCSYLHPELFREKGRVMNITFSLNQKNSGFDANNEMIEAELR